MTSANQSAAAADGVVVLPPFEWVRLPGTDVEVRNHEATGDVMIDVNGTVVAFARGLPDEAVLSFRRAQL